MFFDGTMGPELWMFVGGMCTVTEYAAGVRRALKGDN
ncbi:MAG: hypothetical protein JWM90_2363 [Thermoleophilia bacterium]|nr:hypothetical protein [Thermoleophilia bacterium]